MSKNFKINFIGLKKVLIVANIILLSTYAFGKSNLLRNYSQNPSITSSINALPIDSLRGGMKIQYKSADTQDEEIYITVDNMPSFDGGAEELINWLSNNIIYPQEAIRDSISGVVEIGFIVKYDGSLQEPTIVQSLSPELDQEAIRLVNTMPKWHPGELYGEPVSVRISLPIYFKYDYSGDQAQNASIPLGNMQDLIFYVDDEPKDFKDFIDIDSSEVESVTIYKGDEAVEKYGENAKHGVISVKLKKKESQVE